jgi:hypothetical protein
MISNLKRKLGGMLVLAVALGAAEARAQSLETPGAPAPEAAVAATGPAGFGDSGQFVVSSERLFGYTYRRQSRSTATNTFSLLANPQGISVAGYAWPRLGFDYFVVKGISLGAAASFLRTSGGNANNSLFELAPRVGYSATIGPWLGVWPRLGFSYIHGTFQHYSAVTVEAPLVVTVAPRLAILVAPSLDLGITGSNNTKVTDIALTVGLALTF